MFISTDKSISSTENIISMELNNVKNYLTLCDNSFNTYIYK